MKDKNIIETKYAFSLECESGLMNKGVIKKRKTIQRKKKILILTSLTVLIAISYNLYLLFGNESINIFINLIAICANIFTYFVVYSAYNYLIR